MTQNNYNNKSLFAFNRTLYAVLVLCAFALGLSSCSDDDEPALAGPEISSFEYGEGSTHSADPVAYKGADIHLEAEILAESTVASIAVSIHAHDLTPGEGEVDWDFEQVYTDEHYRVRNPTFHEHVDVPANIPAGEYHITLTVTDAQGRTSKVEGHVEIMDLISVTDISVDGTVVRGSDIHAEFIVRAVNGIHHIVVSIHGHGLIPGEGEVAWDYETEFEEGYHGLTAAEFHEHIDVPATAPAGEYHVTITIEDEDGNAYEMETHLDVTAS